MFQLPWLLLVVYGLVCVFVVLTSTSTLYSLDTVSGVLERILPWQDIEKECRRVPLLLQVAILFSDTDLCLMFIHFSKKRPEKCQNPHHQAILSLRCVSVLLLSCDG